jgi:hypothetical protein
MPFGHYLVDDKLNQRAWAQYLCITSMESRSSTHKYGTAYIQTKFCLFLFSRNEAWRFGEGYTTPTQGLYGTAFRGFKWGFAAFIVTLAVEKYFQKDDDGHH